MRPGPAQLWPEVAPGWILNLPEWLEDLCYDFYKSFFFDDRYMMYVKGLGNTLLLTGKVDCVVIDNEPAKAFVAANEGLKILDTAYAVEDYAAAMSKDNQELYEAVNKALEELIADGTVKTIVEKYIPAE